MGGFQGREPQRGSADPPGHSTQVVPQVRILAVALAARGGGQAEGQGGDTWPGRRRGFVTILVDLQEGEEPFGTPKPILLTVTSVPPALLRTGGCPGSRLVPLVSRRSLCTAGLEMCSTQGFQRPPKQRMCPWVCPPLAGSRTPPSQADFPCSCDKSHLMSSGQTHPNKGYGSKSWMLPLSCESISSAQLCALLGAGSVAPRSSSHRLFLLLLSSKGLCVVTFPLCPEHPLSESALAKVQIQTKYTCGSVTGIIFPLSEPQELLL